MEVKSFSVSLCFGNCFRYVCDSTEFASTASAPDEIAERHPGQNYEEEKDNRWRWWWKYIGQQTSLLSETKRLYSID